MVKVDILQGLKINKIEYVGYKTTRYVSREPNDSSQKLVLYEGETLYDLNSNNCYPSLIPQSVLIQSNDNEISIPASYLDGLRLK